LRTLVLVAFVIFSVIAQAQPQGSPAAPIATEQPAVDKAPAVATTEAATRTAADANAVGWWEKGEWWLVIATWVLAFVSLGVAIFAARLWKTTTALLKETQDTARKELRAYVALDEIFFSEADDTAAGVHKLRIRNYGQTPAYRLSIWCERASHLPQEGVKPFYDAPIVDGQLLHPVQAYTLTLAGAPLYRIGKPGFFTYGRLIYHDIYEQWWVTKFCFRYEGDDTFVPHGDYNHEEGPFSEPPG
jgi:hypothetical protein